MKRKYTEFDNFVISQIKRSFKFLEKEFHCSIIKIENESWGMSIFYKNFTTVVRICLDPTGAGIYVEFIRLVNNEIPHRPINYHKKRIHFFDLGEILDIRVPSLHIDEPALDDLIFNPGREKVVSSVIRQHAKALKMYAQDVLRGDFSIFDELEKTYEKRLKKARQRIKENK